MLGRVTLRQISLLQGFNQSLKAYKTHTSRQCHKAATFDVGVTPA